MPECYFLMWGMSVQYYNSEVSPARPNARRLEFLVTLLKAFAIGMVLGAPAFICMEIAPIYVKSYEFREATRREARLAASNQESEQAIRGDLYQKAQDLGLPVEMQGIKVRAAATEAPATMTQLMDPESHEASTGLVEIEVSYAVPIQFPGYTLRLNFHLHADERSV
jgi:hypothetical protein